MASSSFTNAEVPLRRIFLNPDNPRHDPIETEPQIIAHLCRHEQVLALAKDIAGHGLNPLERFGLIVSDSGGSKENPVYLAGEGNRRICALKLLDDPERAPPEMRQDFKLAAAKWQPPKTLPVTIFHDTEVLDLWLDRIHQGPQGGVGRVTWDATQKQRHSGSSKNRLALAFLDFLEGRGILTSEQRRGKLTTLQRFLGNQTLREALGVDFQVPDGLMRTRPDEDLELLARRLIADMEGDGRKVTSRANKADIISYSRDLGSTPGLSPTRTSPEQVSVQAPAQARQRSKGRRTVSRPPKNLPFDREVKIAVDLTQRSKLISLYDSLCNVELQPNVPLLSVGLWSLLETLTAAMGRKGPIAFDAYLTADRLQSLGLGDNRATKSMRGVVARASAYGNTTKHDQTAAHFNESQLVNDFETLGPLIKACAESIRTKSSP